MNVNWERNVSAGFDSFEKNAFEVYASLSQENGFLYKFNQIKEIIGRVI